MTQSDDPEKPTRKRFPRSVLIPAVLVLLVVGFYLEEDVRGKWDWFLFKHTQEAEGEKFDWADYIPPAVPDDQNFAMTPLLRTAFDYTHTNNELQWRDSNAWQHVMSINLENPGRKGQAPDLGDPDQGTLADLDAAAKIYRDNPNFPQCASPGNSAEVILAALNKFAPDLKELQEAAAARPSSRFPIEYSFQPASEIMLPHLACIKGITSVCELRAVAELEAHRTSDAFADLQLAFRLSDSIHDEPFLIDHQVRIACLKLAIQGIREGIARYAWSDSQLLEFENDLANLDLLKEYERTMRGERALKLSELDYMRRHGASRIFDSNGSLPLANSFNWLPSGWYYRNMRVVGEMYRDYILPAINQSNRVVLPGLGDKMATAIQQLRPSPYSFYAVMLVSGFGGQAMRPARAQTSVDEARVACALERYRLANHDLPDSLHSLQPQFIPQLPHDLFDGLLLRYHKNVDGTYVLYSIGWNQQDDGGTVVVTGGSSPRPKLDQGDWVWKFPLK